MCFTQTHFLIFQVTTLIREESTDYCEGVEESSLRKYTKNHGKTTTDLYKDGMSVPQCPADEISPPKLHRSSVHDTDASGSLKHITSHESFCLHEVQCMFTEKQVQKDLTGIIHSHKHMALYLLRFYNC